MIWPGFKSQLQTEQNQLIGIGIGLITIEVIPPDYVRSANEVVGSSEVSRLSTPIVRR